MWRSLIRLPRSSGTIPLQPEFPNANQSIATHGRTQVTVTTDYRVGNSVFSFNFGDVKKACYSIRVLARAYARIADMTGGDI